MVAYASLARGNPADPRARYDLARSLAGSDDVEAAIQALKEAVDLGWVNPLVTQRDSYLKKLSGHADFELLLRRMESAFGPFQLAQGFRSRYVWSPFLISSLEAQSLDSYYLSTMLAYTGAQGNSVREVRDYLARAKASDGTNPAGTVYLLENSNVRSTTRQPLFHPTLSELRKRGRPSTDLVPRGRRAEGGHSPG